MGDRTQRRTRIGEQRPTALAWGSVVQLNSPSRLRVRFSKKERLVGLLRGQALFEGFKNPARPFIVVGNDACVREEHRAAYGVRQHR